MCSKCLLLRTVFKLLTICLLPPLFLPLPFISPPPLPFISPLHLSSSFSLPLPFLHVSPPLSLLLSSSPSLSPQISEGGSAAATGKLKMGDKILKVNGTDMECATHEEAVMCLVSQEGNIELHIRHEPPPPGIQVCTCTYRHMYYTLEVIGHVYVCCA